jgi:hypothetical protein
MGLFRASGLISGRNDVLVGNIMDSPGFQVASVKLNSANLIAENGVGSLASRAKVLTQRYENDPLQVYRAPPPHANSGPDSACPTSPAPFGTVAERG